MHSSLAEKYGRLKAILRDMGRVVVAYSGGVDSSLVARVSAEILGDCSIAVTSGSSSLKRQDLALAKTLADRWKMRHRVILTNELNNAKYLANPVDRCFHCKTSLYSELQKIADAEGDAVVVNGTNLDDLADHRPGLLAAADFNVRSPLVEAGLCKAEVRVLAAHLGLENAHKPQAACLASRFPYGVSIDEERLAQVERAEEEVLALGFSQVRVRHHEEVARIELPVEDISRALEVREELVLRLKACGYRFVALDLAGFRSGSLNNGVISKL